MRRIAGFMVVGGLVAVLGCDATSPVTPSTPWAPAIAFESGRDGSWGIYVASEDGTHVTFLTPGQDPAWSRDGMRIAYDLMDDINGPAGVYVDYPTGSASPRYVAPGQQPTWGPGDREIAYRGDGGIFAVAVDSSTPPRKLIGDDATLPRPDGWNPDVYGPGWVEGPVWSPDGSQIAFVRVDPIKADSAPPVLNTYVMNVDGSDPRLLAPPCNTPTPEASRLPCPVTGLAWSPSGVSLAVTSFDFDEGAPGGLSPVLGIMPASADSSSADPVDILFRGLGSYPQWSPDGSAIIFSAFVTGGFRIWVFSLNAGFRQLIPDAVDPRFDSYADTHAVWRPLP